MSVQLREVDAPQTAAPILPLEVMTELQGLVIDATMEATEKAYRYAETLQKQTLEELRRIHKPRTVIMDVSVDTVQRKLSKPAPEYLGRMIINAKLGLNTMLCGPAGCGKTVSAGLLAEALALPFGHTCLTAGASETWLFGRQTPTGYISAPFVDCYEHGGVFLADEMDAADANMMLCLNTALANGHLFNPISGKTMNKHKDFVFIGGCNTVGKGGDGVYTGRNRLDAATLNRFVVIQVDYSAVVEEAVCPDSSLREMLQAARTKLREMRSDEVISTRTMEIAYMQKHAGVSLDDIVKSITAGWPEQLISQVMVLPTKSKPTKKKGEKSDDLPF